MANPVTKIRVAFLMFVLISVFVATATACKGHGTWCEQHSECCSGECRGYSMFRGDGECFDINALTAAEQDVLKGVKVLIGQGGRGK